MADDNDDSEETDTTYKISKLAEVIHALFKTHGTDFYPYFDALLPHFVKLLVSVAHTNNNERII